ncbi:MAG: SCO1664 family protein [Actinomycetota bacterium]
MAGRGGGATGGTTETLELLSTGTVEVLGLLPYSSNYVFLARVCGGGAESLAVYKPRRGERPLWDFPRGTLAAREVCAFLVSEASGWGLVPPTVLRKGAPLGRGSLQEFIEHDPERHYFTLLEERPHDFEAFAALDVVINNADRKAGHVLEDAGGKLWSVDHGVTFHPDPKLRTVIWAFAGRPLGEEARSGLESVASALGDGGGLGGELGGLLSATEARAAQRRTEALLSAGRYPSPESDHHLPWPLV